MMRLMGAPRDLCLLPASRSPEPRRRLFPRLCPASRADGSRSPGSPRRYGRRRVGESLHLSRGPNSNSSMERYKVTLRFPLPVRGRRYDYVASIGIRFAQFEPALTAASVFGQIAPANSRAQHNIRHPLRSAGLQEPLLDLSDLLGRILRGGPDRGQGGADGV